METQSKGFAAFVANSERMKHEAFKKRQAAVETADGSVGRDTRSRGGDILFLRHRTERRAETAEHKQNEAIHGGRYEQV